MQLLLLEPDRCGSCRRDEVLFTHHRDPSDNETVSFYIQYLCEFASITLMVLCTLVVLIVRVSHCRMEQKTSAVRSLMMISCLTASRHCVLVSWHEAWILSCCAGLFCMFVVTDTR